MHPTHPAEHRSLARVRRHRAALLVTLLVLAAITTVTAVAGAVAPTAPTVRATAARAITIADKASLHRTSEVGSTIVEEGSATGSLPGRIKARIKVGASISSVAVLYAHGGNIDIHGLGVIQSSGAIANFTGEMTAEGGSGRYAHVRGKASFSGVVDRRDWAMTFSAKGTLSY